MAQKKAAKTPKGPMEQVDVNVKPETTDTGFFPTEGTVYANLPKSSEPTTGGPYDPTVRNNKLNDDGSYQPSKEV